MTHSPFSLFLQKKGYFGELNEKQKGEGRKIVGKCASKASKISSTLLFSISSSRSENRSDECVEGETRFSSLKEMEESVSFKFDKKIWNRNRLRTEFITSST